MSPTPDIFSLIFTWGHAGGGGHTGSGALNQGTRQGAMDTRHPCMLSRTHLINELLPGVAVWHGHSDLPAARTAE